MTFEEFRQEVIAAFAPQLFLGVVSTHDECDDGIALRQELPGKRWDEIPAAFVDFNSGSLPLLTPEALVVFLPKWLSRSMETLGDGSVLAEFTIYFLCPGNGEDGWEEDQIVTRIGLFDNCQRSVICSYLQAISKPRWRPYTEFGLKWWRA